MGGEDGDPAREVADDVPKGLLVGHLYVLSWRSDQ
jgi:hypothetical protein